ncbi:IS3 family transposase [Oceanobacillus kapialis]|uniref:IS3 family transposase n=1 Tax=Oceanobacillus kapialis TaxID=481353 RepID=A0ABW5Q493_9BACI
MGKKRSRPLKEKIEILQAYESEEYSLSDICSFYNTHHKTVKVWQEKYNKYGVNGLKEYRTKKTYPKELKLSAIKDYESGNYSLRDVTRKYEISDPRVLRQWIKKYNGHSEMNGNRKGRTETMTKGRQTEWRERIDIALDCLAKGKDYQSTAELYEVSYQQVYQWVRKFESKGADGLKDGRGRNKTEEELTHEEKTQFEMKRMEKENERLRAENAYLKKLKGDRKEGSLSRVRLKKEFTAIKELHQKEGFSVKLLCKVAGIARSSYYKWVNRISTTEEKVNEEILTEIYAVDKEFNGIYGYRRMKINVNRRLSHQYNHKRIYRLMKFAGIKAVIRKKRKPYIKSTPQHVAENKLKREFTAENPNEKWVTDVTEFKYGEMSKAYLSAILDLHDGSIVSYVIGRSNNNSLVFDTFDKALKVEPEAGPLFHSDRGFQYTSKTFKRKIEKAGMTQSMSRVGKCIDNGPMESFWGMLKSEEYYLNTYSSFEELKEAIEAYINFYNCRRYQESLNGLSPLEYRAKAV